MMWGVSLTIILAIGALLAGHAGQQSIAAVSKARQRRVWVMFVRAFIFTVALLDSWAIAMGVLCNNGTQGVVGTAVISVGFVVAIDVLLWKAMRGVYRQVRRVVIQRQIQDEQTAAQRRQAFAADESNKPRRNHKVVKYDQRRADRHRAARKTARRKAS